MTTTFDAVYENGVFRPTQPVDLPEHCNVEVEVRTIEGKPTRPAPDDVQAIRLRPRRFSVSRIVLTTTLVLISLSLVTAYPQRPWMLGACLGSVLLFTLPFQVGWTIPCMIAGTYLGMMADSPIKGGTPESKMIETIQAIALGTFFGFLAGLAIDLFGAARKETANNGSDSGSSGPRGN